MKVARAHRSVTLGAVLRGLIIAGVVAGLSAPQALADTARTSRKASSKKPSASRSARSCLKALDALGVKYARAKRRGIAIGVRVRGDLGGVTYESYNKKALIIDCSLAVSLAASGPFLTAQGITRAKYSSAYSVRNVRGTRTRSRHSFGLAIDVHSYHGDGFDYAIKDDYEQGLGDNVDCIGAPLTDGGRVLRAINCQMRRAGLFKNILDPDYDGDHYNHFHLATGTWAERTDDPTVYKRRASR